MKWVENEIINGFKLIERSKRKGYWLSEHKCGRIYEFRTTQITNQIFCKGCINEYHSNNKGFNHKSWKGFGELSSDLYTTIKLNAKDRNLDFDLDIEYLWNLFLEQDRKCSLSGLDIHLNSKCVEKKFKTATLDRIDSNIGYIKGNVQWLHRDINKMKNNFPEKYFIKLCELIYKKNGSVEFSELGGFYKNGKYLNSI